MALIKPYYNLSYFVNRIKLFTWNKMNPNEPWLTKGAIDYVKNYLRPNHTLLETGSGRSTIWFSKHVGKVFSIEHDKGWYQSIKERLQNSNIDNVDYHLVTRDFKQDPTDSEYVRIVEQQQNNSFDVVLVDGKHRGQIALLALDKVKPDGVIIIDNVERYLVLNTNAVHKIKEDNEMTDEWKKFNELTSSFEKKVFSNGIWATMILHSNQN